MFGIGKNKDSEEQVKQSEIEQVKQSEIEQVKQIEEKELNEDDAVTSIISSKTQDIENVDPTVTGKEDDADEPAPLTWKEAKALKRARYEEKIASNDNFKNAYVIRNKKTNQIVELRAASSIHAANIIGWKPRKIEVLDVRKIEKPEDVPETVGSSS